MGQDLKCLMGMHRCEIYKEQPVVNVRNEEIGIAIVNRCTNCGKIFVEVVPKLQV